MTPPPDLPADLTQQVIARVAQRHGLTVANLTGQSHTRFVAIARQEAYFEVKRQRPHLSLPKVGKAFGGRDHTTILSGIRSHEKRLAWAEFLIWAGSDEYQPDLFRRAA